MSKYASRLDRLEEQTAREEAEQEAARTTRAREPVRLKAGAPGDPAHAPHARRGEDPLTSRGFRLINLIGAIAGEVSAEDAKVELKAVADFRAALARHGAEPQMAGGRTALVPLASSFLPDAVTAEPEVAVMKALWAADGPADPDEVAWLGRRAGLVRKSAQSYLDDSLGGSLVPPPQQGELIELMRPKEALVRAGATQVPLPPQGKIVYPRQTSPTTAYWVGESQQITDSTVGTGEVALQAKKLAVLVKVPNELFRFASVAADSLIRNDAAKSLALGFDYAGFYGGGGTFSPKGLVNYTGSNELIDYAGTTPTPSGVAANGNTVQPQDGLLMAGQIEDRNFECSGFVMRPLMWAAAATRRADAVTAADSKGPFVQSITRNIADGLPNNWVGLPVTKSAVIRNNQTKGGSGATLTEIWAAQWEHILLGMYGAVEFKSSDVGDTPLANDQTWVRAILFCDVAPRYPGAVAYYKQLLVS